QRVHGNVVFGDVGLELLQRPVGDGVQLDELLDRVPGGERNVSASGRLGAAQAREPTGSALKRAVERADLADLAARLAVLDGEAEAVDAVARDELLDLARIREDDADLAVIAALAFLERVERLGEMAACIQREDVEIDARRGDGVKHRLILKAEAGREGYPARHRLGDRLEAILQRLQGRQSLIERADVGVI